MVNISPIGSRRSRFIATHQKRMLSTSVSRAARSRRAGRAAGTTQVVVREAVASASTPARVSSSSDLRRSVRSEIDDRRHEAGRPGDDRGPEVLRHLAGIGVQHRAQEAALEPRRAPCGSVSPWWSAAASVPASSPKNAPCPVARARTCPAGTSRTAAR